MSSPAELIEAGQKPLRLFTAIALPADLKERLSELLSRLQKGAVFTGAHPTWVAAENIHITLVFLGEQLPDKVAAIRESADVAARKAQPFDLELGGLHLFPTPKEPRVISLGITGDVKQLAGMRDHLASELKRRGLEVESRPFRPHITLARIKSMRGLAGIRGLVSGHQQITVGKMRADRITLYKSTLRSNGPEYEVLYEAVLGKAGGDSLIWK